MIDFEKELVQFLRIALTTDRQGLLRHIRALAQKTKGTSLSNQLIQLVTESPKLDSPLRNSSFSTIPRDHDSNLKLIRIEDPVVLNHEPIWEETVERGLLQILHERNMINELLKEGLAPSKSLLLTGPPGVGKTLAAKWIADRLQCPLLTLDLSAVISSFLGKTGSNVRYVLDYAKSTRCVLLLDELDAIAKRRDDATEIGELKRLVTVLLQEIDEWPQTGLLIAATNHPDLLDRAVWRRFDIKIEFPMPSDLQIQSSIAQFFEGKTIDSKSLLLLPLFFNGFSFSDIFKELNHLHRKSVLEKKSFDGILIEFIKSNVQKLKPSQRKKVALDLLEQGVSQRTASHLTGVHRDTIRKVQNQKSELVINQ